MRPVSRITALILGLSLALPAHALPNHTLNSDPHIMVQDWKAQEVTDALVQGSVCRASTTVSQGAFPVELSVNLPKSAIAPPYVVLKIYGAEPMPSTALVKMDARVSHPLLAVASEVENETAVTSYVYIPLDLPRLYAKIRDELWLDLMLSSEGTSVPVRVSLRGSAATLRELAKCLGASSVSLPTDYFRSLNTAETSVAPNVSEMTPVALFESTLKAFSAFQQGRDLQAQLSRLQAQMAQLVRAEETAQRAFADVDGRMNGLLAHLESHRQRLASAQEALARAQADLPALQAELAAADQEVAEKESIFRPLQSQLKPYDDRIASARTIRDRHAAEVRRLEGLINRLPGEIGNHQRRVSQLSGEISNLNGAIHRLEAEERSLQNAVSRFNVEFEARRILQNDFSYTRLVQDERRLRDRLQSARQDERQKQAALDRAERELQQCRNARPRDVRPDRPTSGDFAVGPISPGQPGGPNRPQPPRPPQPPPPPPPPAPNCSAEQARVQAARREVNQARQEVSRAESDLNRNQREQSLAETRARSQAQNELSRLQNDLWRVTSARRDHENRAQQARSEHDRLLMQIQSLQNELTAARNSLPGQQSARDRAATDLSTATHERNALAVQIGFGPAQQAFQAAVSRRDGAKAAVEAKQTEINRVSAQVRTESTEVSNISGQIERLRPSHVAALARLEEARAQLKPAREQEFLLGGQIAAAKAELDQQRVNYQTIRTTLLAGLQ